MESSDQVPRSQSIQNEPTHHETTLGEHFPRTPDTWSLSEYIEHLVFHLMFGCVWCGDNAVIYYDFCHNGKEQIKSYPRKIMIVDFV